MLTPSAATPAPLEHKPWIGGIDASREQRWEDAVSRHAAGAGYTLQRSTSVRGGNPQNAAVHTNRQSRVTKREIGKSENRASKDEKERG